MLVCCFAGSTPLSVHAETLYRWVDEQGNVTFQSTPPPSNAKQVDELQLKTRAATASQASKLPIVAIYVIDDCDDCNTLSETLMNWGVPFTRYNPQANRDVADKMQERFGKVEVPIVTVGSAVVRGLNVPWLRSELTDAGYSLPQ